MENREKTLVNNCDFMGIRPMMMDLPYPAIQVREKNPLYANLLSIDYCGAVSELSAITQYINNENRLSCENCPGAKTLLGIAMAEMIHLQKLAIPHCISTAAAPVTKGVAKEVPVTGEYPPFRSGASTFTPGATRSGFTKVSEVRLFT